MSGPRFLISEKFLITVSIFLLVIHLFGYLISSSFSFERLYSKNVSISSDLLACPICWCITDHNSLS